MEKQILEKLIDDGKSSYEISKLINLSQTSVRHWLKKYNLKTKWNQFKKKERFGTRQICKKHGITEFSISDKPRCRKCTVEAVQKKRLNIKKESVKYLGGKCIKCGYDKCVEALDFHHKNPAEKEFTISQKGHTRSWKKVKDELNKCIILCANCHREFHAGLFGLP